MAQPEQLPAALHVDEGQFLSTLQDRQLVFFLCNVGDADAQLVLLPRDPATGVRRALIVDAGHTGKLPELIDALVAEDLLPTDPATGQLEEGALALVVATHPHRDHIAGMAELLERYGHAVSELWDSGYYHPTPDYVDMMGQLEDLGHVVYSQPSSGLRRFIGDTAITVLSPSIQLRNRFDTYGVEVNDASVSLRIEFPASRVVERTEGRALQTHSRPASLILGADAQTLSWSYVLSDFPNIPHSDSDAARAIRAATGRDLLGSQVLKVSHHGSKHGVNLELVERINPGFTLMSCGSGGRYNFPHDVAQEVIREAREPVASSNDEHSDDAELGLFYTSDRDNTGAELGTIAVVMTPGRRTMWRFSDAPGDPIDFNAGRRWNG